MRIGTHWYAIHTKAQMERPVYRQLQLLGYWAFHPIQKVKRWRKVPGRSEKRREDVTLPYMPRYTFVRACRSDVGLLNTMPGVSTVVSVDGEPVSVPGIVMRALMGMSAEERDDSGRPVGALVGAVDRTKVIRAFGGKIGDSVRLKDDFVFSGFVARIADLADLDETGQIKVWLKLLGSERLIPVPVEAIATAA